MIKTYGYTDNTQLSPHFNAREFRCKCGKEHDFQIDDDLITKLEKLYTTLNCSKIIITSGFRCVAHDKSVGGSGTGQHTLGKAADTCCYGQDGQPISSKTVCCKAQDTGFTGIANITAAYIYTHVDVRSGSKWYGDEVHGNSSVTDDFYKYFGGEDMKGIDVSVHNGKIDWQKVKAAGIDFAVLRAGYGKLAKQKDDRFEENYAGAKAAGIPVGAYWYSYAMDEDEACQEADVFLSVIKGKQFEFTILASFAQEESRSISENVKWGIRKRFENGEMCCKNPVLGYEWVDDQLIVVPEEAAIVKRIFQNFLDGKSRLETERELNGEGITTKNGCRWQDSSIKVVLTNITYTGNLLFQKEYITDPITKRRRKNKGELPQYFVEGTHEAIIDMETFQYVQAEMQRRRELGALANKSLNTCCFTGKLKCPFCGQSYMHNTRKDRGSFQEFWSCGAIKKKGGRCPVGGSINHKHLRETCAKVLGLPEFDEEVFLAQVDVILVPARETLEFHLKDGAVVTEECKNTGHQECWTPERRAATAKRRRDSAAPNRPDATCFTKKIKCIRCELNYRRGTRKDIHHWRCAGKNGCLSLREEVLKSLTAEVLGLTEFDDDVFLEQISRIEVHDNDMLRYCFYDGRTEERQYIAPPKRGRKWTAHQREVMAQKVSASWTPERRADMSVRAKEMRRREKLAKNH